MAAPFHEFADNRRLLWIAREWDERSDDLAEWAMERLVNRRDVWSQYTLKGDKISVVMLPIKARRDLGTDMVTLVKLKRHFSGRGRGHLIGLHSISATNTCKWFAIDVDLHDPTASNAGEIAEKNLNACLVWASRLREKLLDPCLMDSNGAGGYHLWVLLDREYPMTDVYRFADGIRADWAEFGLPRKPEIFPPKEWVEPGHIPYGLRLPGRHHTIHHYTRIWNFDSFSDSEWLEGAEAIDAMIGVRPGPLPALDEPKAEPTAPAKPMAKAKPRVCVDLDGVLAKYDKWRGQENIGEPLPGAIEFATELSKIADIVIFTSRCSDDTSRGDHGVTLSAGQMRIHVIDWLERNKIPFADVYIGQGKPKAAAFIDDRAVNCNPQKVPSAYEDTLEAVEGILKKKKRERKA